MPYLSRRLLVSLCPLVNLDLFKKGYYHVSCRLIDLQSDQTRSAVTCSEIRDLLGPQLTEFVYPGACLQVDHFITQTVSVEYTDQSFPLGESFIFSSAVPIRVDYTEVYIPSHFSLQLNLMFSGTDELPKDPSSFSRVSTRTLNFTIDWRKGLHDYFPVIFDYFHMAAIGVTVHASMYEFNLDDYPFDLSTTPALASRRTSLMVIGSKRRSSYQATPTRPPPSPLPSLSTILFGSKIPSLDEETDASTSRQQAYVVPTLQLQRAQDAHQMLCDVLRSARDSLHIGYAIMSGEKMETEILPDIGDIGRTTSLKEAEEECCKQITLLNSSLAATWEWFCQSAVVHPEMFSYLASRSHNVKLLYQMETLISNGSPHLKNVANIASPVTQAMVAAKVRRSLQVPLPLCCNDNIENSITSSILFIEPCPWQTVDEIQAASRPLPPAGSSTNPLLKVPGATAGLEGFATQVHPSLLKSLPQRGPFRRTPGVHLVICVHGLQGNQFDLRLYRIFLQMALPQVKFDFLMAQSNQSDTFCDFNRMTDLLLEEITEYVREMPTPPSKVSFIGHSLGSIVVRSLVTRPEFLFLQPKLHLFLSICSPHLGTRFQTGIVSLGMWAVRRWYNSKSLLQLSIKDAPNSRDSFLYHLSESPSMENFRHVVLLCSPQDKYVPYQSAKMASVAADGSLQSDVSLEMMHNILEPLRQAKVNLVRVSVDHSLPTSANSVIGRAAHIAMLDNELFIEKFVSLHLAQYFTNL